MPNLGHSKAFSSFATNDVPATKAFYAETLGLEVTEENGLLNLHLGGGSNVLVYPKDNHEPATYTVLNFPLADIETAVDALAASGIEFERYEGTGQDERGIAREFGPPIAWFKDPAGNILAVLEDNS